MPSMPSDSAGGATRRQFLERSTVTAGVAALAAGAEPTPSLAAAQGPPADAALLPTVALGPHRITRMILGGNPIYGHSHFNRLFSRHLTDWHTPDRVQELLRRCEAVGINTWQNSYAARTLEDLDRYRESGGKMHWLCLGKPDWDEHPDRIDDAAKRKPIGIAPHGALAEKLHRRGKIDTLKDLLKRIRQTGVLVGLSAHNPAVIDLAEEQGWDVDYYMCCLYYLTRPRDEFEKLIGNDLPLGEIYLPSDPPRMLQTIRQTRKPCLAYKILAAGRRIGTANEVRQSFAAAFSGIKPIDAVIVGMYQQFSDQPGENAAIVREILDKPA